MKIVKEDENVDAHGNPDMYEMDDKLKWLSWPIMSVKKKQPLSSPIFHSPIRWPSLLSSERKLDRKGNRLMAASHILGFQP